MLMLLLSDDAGQYIYFDVPICIILTHWLDVVEPGGEIMTPRQRYSSISPHQNHIRWYFIFGPPLLFCYDMIRLAFVQCVIGKNICFFLFHDKNRNALV